MAAPRLLGGSTRPLGRYAPGRPKPRGLGAVRHPSRGNRGSRAWRATRRSSAVPSSIQGQRPPGRRLVGHGVGDGPGVEGCCNDNDAPHGASCGGIEVSCLRRGRIVLAPDSGEGGLDFLLEARDQFAVGVDQRLLGFDLGDDGLLRGEGWQGDFKFAEL